ncbi:MAG: nonstructural protein [Microvirus sp.]|nr:MAG: nonstructural protein [Microvirus sp.]
MTKIVCAVYDHATEAYGAPFFVPHRGAALRSFNDEVNRKAEDNQLYMHASDFSLWQLAYFDELTGRFTDAVERLSRGSDVRVQP